MASPRWTARPVHGQTRSRIADGLSMSDLLRVENLRLSFSLHGIWHEVVKGVSFRVRRGSVVALVGESGSGKSVMAQAIMGILPLAGAVTGGRILFADPKSGGEATDIAALDPYGPEMRALRGSRMSMIFQEPMTSLAPLHTIGNQIAEALTTHVPVSSAEARAASVETLELVGFPNPARAFDMYSFELSGGLRQRAMIAMALICRPALLIADEPTTALDVTIQAQVLSLLKELQQKLEMGMLLITHDLGVVANMADEVVVIYHGEVMEAGPVEAVFRRSRHPYLKALLNAVPHFDMKPGERLVSVRDVGEARQTPRTPPRRELAKGDRPLLSIRDLHKSFTIQTGSWFGSKSHRTSAVNGVSFDIRRGECLGLVGESGCGKTTVSKLIIRALTPDRGIMRLNAGGAETDLLTLEGAALKAFRTRIQMVFQDPVSSLSPRMTVLNILREPLQIHGRGSAKDQVDRCVELMREVGLDPRFLNRYPHSFSGGQRQRIGIARALALNPDMVICDEPVSALDVSVQAQILNLLLDLKTELGLTYLFISHNLAVVDYIADRIAVMARGRLVEIAPRHVLFRRPIHPYTRALLDAVPYPDLDRRLNLKALSLGGASDESYWAPQFRQSGVDGAMCQIDLGEEHRVLANPNANASELRP
jgi:peptide/nickel transport system ATP-binding protein